LLSGVFPQRLRRRQRQRLILNNKGESDMKFRIVLALEHEEVVWLLSAADMLSGSRNPVKRELARKIREGVDGSQVDPGDGADEPHVVEALYRDKGGESGGA
jgi:hypothetical protein